MPELDRLIREYRSIAWEIFGEAMTHDFSFTQDKKSFLAEWQRARHEAVELVERAVKVAYRAGKSPAKAKDFCKVCGQEVSKTVERE